MHASLETIRRNFSSNIASLFLDGTKNRSLLINLRLSLEKHKELCGLIIQNVQIISILFVHFDCVALKLLNKLNCTSISLLLLSFYNTSLSVTMSVCLKKKKKKLKKKTTETKSAGKCILNQMKDFKYNFRDIIVKTKAKTRTHNMININQNKGKWNFVTDFSGKQWNFDVVS